MACSSTSDDNPSLYESCASSVQEENESEVEESMESQSAGPSKCRSYSREKKLQILQYYYKYNCKKYKTCQKFGVSKPCRWIASEKEIREGKKRSKRIPGGGHRPFWPDVEGKLLQS